MSPTATATRIVVARRFNGPPASANGGYACGLLAALVDGPAEVTLRRPVRLDVALDAERHDDGHVTLHHDGELVAEADPALPLDLEPPYRPSLEEAREAACSRPGDWPAMFGSCFVCAPARHDGLGVTFGPLRARPDMNAAVLDVPAGGLAPELVWAALDCPSYTPPLWNGSPSLLGRMTAELLEPIEPGEPLVVAGWTLHAEGRKHTSAAALLGADGRTLARAQALWIRLRA